MIVREFIDDLDDCAKLWRRTFNSPPWNDNWSMETARKKLDVTLSMNTCIALVAEEAGRVVGLLFGYITWFSEAKAFCIEDLCVDPDYQRREIGTTLLSRLETELQGRDVKAAFLTTAKGFPAEGFYRDNGFEQNKFVSVLRKIF